MPEPIMLANVTTKPLCPLLEQMSHLQSHSNSSIRYMDHASVLLHGLASLLGLVENGLILFVVGCRMRQTVVTTWVLHLALSDLLATASLPFFTYFLAVGHSWKLGTTFCKLHSSIFFLNMFASGFLLSAISLDRCLQVVRPVWAQNHRTVAAAHKVCLALWVLAVINTVPYFVFRDTIPRLDGRIMCYYNVLLLSPGPDRNATCDSRQTALAVSKFLLAFAVPLAIIASSHLAVSAQLRHRGRRRSSRFVRLVAAVVAAFALCWGPYHVFSVMEARAHANPSLRPLVWRGLPFVTSLAFINSVINPLLYVFTCPDVLRKLRRSLRSVLESVLVDDSDLTAGSSNRRRRRASSTNASASSISDSSGHLLPALWPARLLDWLRGDRAAPPQRDRTLSQDERGPLNRALSTTSG
ncbi:PREDICTED: prostaglandin D2 receptor 2 isoform X1 [Capra hircus]|uniref:prostaglandin D2 receptor 2 isoform X1 n=2 Tax=Capra hircus TaxID=9925 RepID=UPI0008472589|nr:PREDICTED: prostaglandin D2 receptor 2 isoform X1 [Capra hircus]